MTFLIAAAGTGGHVFPGLSVAEGLVELGVPRDEILFVGGDRLEAEVYPREGFRLLQVELAGLKRAMTLDNARLPGVVMRARRRIASEIAEVGVRVVLGMGGYVTIPAAMAARRSGVAFFNAEQNAEAGLANRLTARWAVASFTSFPVTGGIPGGTWVGNPVRRGFWDFDRETMRPAALGHYELTTGSPVLGVFGGSLGARVINDAVSEMLETWAGPPLSVVHITGPDHIAEVTSRPAATSVVWRRVGFEESMASFFAAVDLVIARAGGSVAELTATATPSVLVPGKFGSVGHQVENARFLEKAGAALVLDQDDLMMLPSVVSALVSDTTRVTAMSAATRDLAKPDAALTIARTMIEAAT